MARPTLTDRRDRIIALLSQNDALSPAELSQRLDVSVQTIRADLRDLDDAARGCLASGDVSILQGTADLGRIRGR